MNKLSTLLLVTAVIVSTGAIANWRGNGKDRMHEYWNMKMEQWNTAINKQNAKTKAEAEKLLKQVEAKHDAMVAEFKKIDNEKIKNLRREKHKLMYQLDRMLGLKTTREKIHEKAREIKANIKGKLDRPVVVKSKPVVVKSKPVVVKSKPVVVKSKPVVVETVTTEEAIMAPVMATKS